MNKIKLIISLGFLTVYAFAFVPITDVANEIRENIAMSKYVAQIPDFVNNIAKTEDTVYQLTNLNQLIAVQQNITKLCNIICSQNDRKTMQNYLNSLNQNIIGQFKNYTSTLDKNISTLKQLSAFITQTPLNTKELGVALQKATQESLEQVQSTLLQIQALLVLDSQKRQIENKVEKVNTDAVYSGFTKSGL